MMRRLALLVAAALVPTLAGCTIYIPAGNFLPSSGPPRTGTATQPQPVLRPAPVLAPQIYATPQAAVAAPSTGGRVTPGEMSGLLGG